MLNLKLDETDVINFLRSFECVGEMVHVDLCGDTKLRHTIANMIGDIRSQVPDEITSGLGGFRARVDVRSLLVSKYKEWEEDRKFDREIDPDIDIEPAYQVIHDTLNKYELGTYLDISMLREGPVAAIDALEKALYAKDAEHASNHADSIEEEEALMTRDAWTGYQVGLCTCKADDIDMLSLVSVIEDIIAYRDERLSDVCRSWEENQSSLNT